MPYRKSKYSSVGGAGRGMSGGRGGKGSSIALDLKDLGRTSAEYNPYSGGSQGDVPIDPELLPPMARGKAYDPSSGMIDPSALTTSPHFFNSSTPIFGRDIAGPMNRELQMQEASNRIGIKNDLELLRERAKYDLEARKQLIALENAERLKLQESLNALEIPHQHALNEPRLQYQEKLGSIQTKQDLTKAKALKDMDMASIEDKFALESFGKLPSAMTPEERMAYDNLPIARLREFAAKTIASQKGAEESAFKSQQNRRVMEATADTDLDTAKLGADIKFKSAHDARSTMFSPEYEIASRRGMVAEAYKPYTDLHKPVSLSPGETQINNLNVPELDLEPSVMQGSRFNTKNLFNYKVVGPNDPNMMRMTSDISKLQPGEFVTDKYPVGEEIQQLPPSVSYDYTPGQPFGVLGEVPGQGYFRRRKPTMGTNGTNMFHNSYR